METKICSQCNIVKPVNEFNLSKRNKSGFRCECRECQKKIYSLKSEYYKQKRKERYQKDTDKELIRNRTYYKINKEKIIYQKTQKIKNDINLRIISNLRSRICSFVKSKNLHKDNQTKIILGIDLDLFKKHIEKQFQLNMTWDNYGDWHIDHIIPLNSANSEEELFKLCHYTNLQPLWAYDNLSKGCRILN
jgi:hypothetical protein